MPASSRVPAMPKSVGVIFELRRAETLPGEALLVVGAGPALGNWQPLPGEGQAEPGGRCLRTSAHLYPCWTTRDPVWIRVEEEPKKAAWGGAGGRRVAIEYKFVRDLGSAEGSRKGERLQWETHISNRRATLPMEDGSVWIVSHACWNAAREPPEITRATPEETARRWQSPEPSLPRRALPMAGPGAPCHGPGPEPVPPLQDSVRIEPPSRLAAPCAEKVRQLRSPLPGSATASAPAVQPLAVQHPVANLPVAEHLAFEPQDSVRGEHPSPLPAPSAEKVPQLRSPSPGSATVPTPAVQPLAVQHPVANLLVAEHLAFEPQDSVRGEPPSPSASPCVEKVPQLPLPSPGSATEPTPAVQPLAVQHPVASLPVAEHLAFEPQDSVRGEPPLPSASPCAEKVPQLRLPLPGSATALQIHLTPRAAIDSPPSAAAKPVWPIEAEFSSLSPAHSTGALQSARMAMQAQPEPRAAFAPAPDRASPCNPRQAGGALPRWPPLPQQAEEVEEVGGASSSSAGPAAVGHLAAPRGGEDLLREVVEESCEKERQIQGLRGENERLRGAVELYKREVAMARLYADNERLRNTASEACDRAEALCRENAALRQNLLHHGQCERLVQLRSKLRQTCAPWEAEERSREAPADGHLSISNGEPAQESVQCTGSIEPPVEDRCRQPLVEARRTPTSRQAGPELLGILARRRSYVDTEGEQFTSERFRRQSSAESKDQDRFAGWASEPDQAEKGDAATPHTMRSWAGC